jgi:nitroimidazol reductase NimA-like FMN-containing flavoprotein (pyridoxamine 5'-phosphate oxidase superfamily)
LTYVNPLPPVTGNDRLVILNIISTQSDLTLATLREDGYPQANTLCYVNEGFILYFATDRNSQKIRNLQHCNRVSLTIDVPYVNRSQIRGLSMSGVAELLHDDLGETLRARDLLYGKFPIPWEAPPPAPPGQVMFVKIAPQIISVLDYSKGFGHAELVRVGAQDLRG